MYREGMRDYTGRRYRVYSDSWTWDPVSQSFLHTKTDVSPSQLRWPVTRWSKSWERTPNYANLLRSGARLPDQPFSYSEEKIPLVSWYSNLDATTSKIYRAGFDERLTYIGGAPWIDWASGEQLLNTKLLQKARSSTWNAPVFLAEAKKTSKMVTDTATTFIYVLRDLKKGNFYSAFDRLAPRGVNRRKAAASFNKRFGSDTSKAVSDAWLQMKYGWAPLMKDVQDAVETLQDVVDQPERLVGRVTVGGSIPKYIVKDYGPLDGTFEGAYVRRLLDVEVDTHFRFVWKFAVNRSDLPNRFGLLNPLEVIWELIPYSFVVDWFLPIGDYLSALSARFTLNHVGGTQGARSVARVLTKTKLHPTYFQPGISFGASDALYENTLVVRRKMTAAPALILGPLKSPLDLNLNQMFTSLTLLRQQFKKL